MKLTLKEIRTLMNLVTYRLEYLAKTDVTSIKFAEMLEIHKKLIALTVVISELELDSDKE